MTSRPWKQLCNKAVPDRMQFKSHHNTNSWNKRIYTSFPIRNALNGDLSYSLSNRSVCRAHLRVRENKRYLRNSSTHLIWLIVWFRRSQVFVQVSSWSPLWQTFWNLWRVGPMFQLHCICPADDWWVCSQMICLLHWSRKRTALNNINHKCAQQIYWFIHCSYLMVSEEGLAQMFGWYLHYETESAKKFALNCWRVKWVS